MKSTLVCLIGILSFSTVFVLLIIEDDVDSRRKFSIVEPPPIRHEFTMRLESAMVAYVRGRIDIRELTERGKASCLDAIDSLCTCRRTRDPDAYTHAETCGWAEFYPQVKPWIRRFERRVREEQEARERERSD